MATTIRDQIIEALLNRLRTINESAQRTYIRLLDQQLPAACLWDSIESGGNVIGGKQSCSLAINVAMGERLTINDNASEFANKMLGQLLIAMIGTDPRLSGLADTVKYQSSSIVYPEPGGDFIIGIDVAFAVEYNTALGDPYTQ